MTKDEGGILAQIAADVSNVRVTVERIDVRTTNLQDISMDHEIRIRELAKSVVDPDKHEELAHRVDDLERYALTRKGFIPVLTVIILAAGVVYNLVTGIHG